MAVEETSKQYSIKYIAWLLVATLKQIYNEMEPDEQEKNKNMQFGNKSSIRTYNGVKSSAQRVNAK